jgi:acyl-CoA reductase-like NAD-dependent aldehyde dehydrogenase
MATTHHNGTSVSHDDHNTIQVRNPITEEVIGSIPVATPEDVADAVERARFAQKTWGAMPITQRTQIIRRWLDLVWENQAELIRIIRRETGKTDGMAFNEILVIDNMMQFYIHRAAQILKPQARPAMVPVVHHARVYYKPRGVVGIISPWNFPFNLPFIDGIPALIAGNTLVFKPSEITPFSCEFGVEMLYKAGVPRDVVQIVHGTGETGAALVDEVDYIAFTGSTAVGRKVASRAGERLIGCSIELGGKDPMIILNDADIDFTVSWMLRGAFENAGQFCMGIERIYVEDGIYDNIMERLMHFAPQYRMGTGDGFGVHMGSLTNEREVLRCEAQIADAVAKGAKVIHGGNRRPDLGPLFFEPTIVVDVDHSMDIMREETFGPLMPVMRVKNADEAIRLANDNEYGLAAAVFTRDLRRGEQLATRIESGDVCVNAAYYVIGTPGLPSGGVKNSGLSRRNGVEGLLRYVSSQSVLVNTGIAQQPSLEQPDALTRQAVQILRKIRRYVPFL